MNSENSEIFDKISTIRRHINNPRKQYYLLQDLKKWNKLCCSLDVIEDAQNAINFYLNSDHPNESGAKYLYIYGLFQAIFLQQDAVYHTSNVLGLDFKYAKD